MLSFFFWAASQASTHVYLHPPVLQNVLSADSSVGKETASKEGDPGSIPGWGRSPGEPTPGFLSGKSQGQGSLVGCRLWGCTE